MTPLCPTSYPRDDCECSYTRRRHGAAEPKEHRFLCGVSSAIPGRVTAIPSADHSYGRDVLGSRHAKRDPVRTARVGGAPDCAAPIGAADSKSDRGVCADRSRHLDRHLAPGRNVIMWCALSRSRACDQCTLLAQSGHCFLRCECPLLGVKRTWAIALQMSAYDPKRT